MTSLCTADDGCTKQSGHGVFNVILTKTVAISMRDTYIVTFVESNVRSHFISPRDPGNTPLVKILVSQTTQ